MILPHAHRSESLGRKRGVVGGVSNVSMPEERLDQPRIGAFIRQHVACRVPQHMWVCLYVQLGQSAGLPRLAGDSNGLTTVALTISRIGQEMRQRGQRSTKTCRLKPCQISSCQASEIGCAGSVAVSSAI